MQGDRKAVQPKLKKYKTNRGLGNETGKCQNIKKN